MTTREALRSAVAAQVGPGKVDAVLRAVVETLGEPVAWGIMCTIHPDCHEPYEAMDHVVMDRESAEYMTTIYTKGSRPRLVPLVPLSALLDSVEPATDG